MPKSQNPFEKNSWYFRNSHVRANYTNMTKGIYMNTEYLEKFFRNLLLGEANELKNRYVHIRTENLPVNKTQRLLLELLLESPKLTYDELAEKMNKTRETVRTNLRTLEEKQLVQRIGAGKNGHWEVLI